MHRSIQIQGDEDTRCVRAERQLAPSSRSRRTGGTGSSARGVTAASSAPAEAISCDTFQGVGEIAIEVVQHLAVARLKAASKGMRGTWAQVT